MVERVDLPLRVVVEGPVPGFVMALQRGASGKAQFVPPVGGSEAALERFPKSVTHFSD